MSLYTPIVTVYAIVITILWGRQVLREHRRLADVLVASRSCKTITNLAADVGCTRSRAWIFLVLLRARRCIKSVPLAEGMFINTYGYELNPKGRAMLTCDMA